MRLSVFKKYFLSTAVIFLVCLLLTVSVLSVVITRFFTKQRFDILERSCNSVNTIAENDFTSSNYKRNLVNILHTVSDSNGINIIVTDENGKPIACGCDDFAKTQNCIHTNKVTFEKVICDFSDGNYKSIGDLDGTLQENDYVFATEITNGSKTLLGYVFASSPISDINSLFFDLLKLFLLSAILPLIIMFLVLYYLTFKWTRPLKYLSQASKRIAKGDFSEPVPIFANDEVGDVCRSFNEMTESLKSYESAQRNFIGNVSHEMRTPMTIIGGYVDGMLDGTIPKEIMPKYLKIISDEIERLTRLIQSMLSLSKLESGELSINLSYFNFSQLIVNAFLSHEQIIEKKKIVIKGLDTLEKCNIIADTDLIYQAIFNLVDNAVKFTDDGGTITVALENKDDFINFKIRNTGYGIPKNDLEHIFDRFYKTDKSRSLNKESTGLGLYIVKTIINLHSGRISADSKIDNYTEFSVELPTVQKGE